MSECNAASYAAAYADSRYGRRCSGTTPGCGTTGSGEGGGGENASLLVATSAAVFVVGVVVVDDGGGVVGVGVGVAGVVVDVLSCVGVTNKCSTSRVSSSSSKAASEFDASEDASDADDEDAGVFCCPPCSPAVTPPWECSFCNALPVASCCPLAPPEDPERGNIGEPSNATNCFSILRIDLASSDKSAASLRIAPLKMSFCDFTEGWDGYLSSMSFFKSRTEHDENETHGEDDEGDEDEDDDEDDEGIHNV